MTKRRTASTRGLFATALAIGALGSGLVMPSDAARSDSFKKSGFIGSQIATMQQVTTPARVARVEVIPGTNGAEAWGVGRSQANLGNWASSAFGGQAVFLRHRKGSPWELTGPPLDQSGMAINHDIYEISIAPGG